MSAGFWHSALSQVGYWPWSLIIPAYLFAQLRGDKSARALSGVLALAALLGTLLAASAKQPSLVRGDLLGLDVLLLAAQVWISLRSCWLYPIGVAAGQLLMVLSEAGVAAGFSVHAPTLEVLVAALAAFQLAAFATGLAWHRNRRPLWRTRARRENASAELAPRANRAR